MDYGAEYARLHEQYPKYFAGWTIKRYVDDIVKAVDIHGAKTLLDYGSGKGYQYLVRRVHERWGNILPTCYDVGVRQLAERPVGIFDGVICTDMLEHIEEADVPRILDDLLHYTGKFAVFGISCRPETKDVKKLSDGRGVHICVKPPAWWAAQIKSAIARDARVTPLVVYAIYEPPDAPLIRETITP